MKPPAEDCQLTEQYADAFDQWADSPEPGLWDAATADGLDAGEDEVDPRVGRDPRMG